METDRKGSDTLLFISDKIDLKQNGSNTKKGIAS